MSWRASALLLLCAICWGRAAEGDSVVDGSGFPDLKLLFVGNSLIYYNGGVYKVVASLLSDRFPDATIQADQVVWPNFLLSQHLQRAETPGTPQAETFGPNSTGRWDFVLFQEESQQVALGGDSDAQSLEALTGLTKLAAARGAKVGVDLTWAWLDGKNAKFPVFRDMQDKVNAGYAANMKELTASTGIPAFLAPTGLGWQVVDDLMNAAKSSNNTARSPATSAASAALSQTAQQQEDDELTVLKQLDSAGQNAAVSPAASPAARKGVSLQVESPTRQICKGSAAAAEGEVGPAGAPAATLAASQTGAPQVAPRPAAASARRLPVQAAQAPAAQLPATAQSIQFVIGRRMQGLTKPALAAGGAARRLLQAQPQVKQAVPFLYGRRRAPVALGPGPVPSAIGAVSAASLTSMPASQAPAPRAVLAGSPVSAPVQAPAPLQPNQDAPEVAPAGAPAPLEAVVVEEAPNAEHESVTLLRRAMVPAPAPALTGGATVEGLTGGICSPGALPAGADTFTQMYAPDGNHPSEAGTYLEGLLIASSMTGCKMTGNGFTFGLEQKWYSFLQELSDAIIFEGTPREFPPYPWQTNDGPTCTLKI